MDKPKFDESRVFEVKVANCAASVKIEVPFRYIADRWVATDPYKGECEKRYPKEDASADNSISADIIMSTKSEVLCQGCEGCIYYLGSRERSS